MKSGVDSNPDIMHRETRGTWSPMDPENKSIVSRLLVRFGVFL